MSTTRLLRRIRAPRSVVYRALIDPVAVAEWRVPDGMTSHVHHYEAREGGSFRISLTYSDPSLAGKTAEHTDTYHGRFVELVPDERVVEVMEFESGDPGLGGEMRVTFTLREVGEETELLALHENVPAGVPPEDNELGWSMSIDKLVAHVEQGRGAQG